MRVLGVDVGVGKGLDVALLDERRRPLLVRSRVPVAALGAVIDETAPTPMSPPTVSVASPNGARLSITTSAISLRRLPLGCLGMTALVCSRLVTAIS